MVDYWGAESCKHVEALVLQQPCKANHWPQGGVDGCFFFHSDLKNYELNS